MKQFVYILFIIFLGLQSCAGNSDQPDPVPPPPPPDPTKPDLVGAKEDDLIGTWETYYYLKDIYYTETNGKVTSLTGLSLIDYNGYRTKFSKTADGVYSFESYNVIGHVNDAGTYSVSNGPSVDTIVFKYTKKDDKATTGTGRQVINRLNPSLGVLKTIDIYAGKVNNSTATFTLYDRKSNRNVLTAPTYSDVTPAKVEIDFEYMSAYPWVVTGCAYYDNGIYNSSETAKMETALKGVTYRFYTKNGQKRCTLEQLDPATGQIGTEDFPLMIIDDVIYYFYDTVDPETGEQKLADIFTWVYKFQTKNGKEQFIDRYVERNDQDLSNLIVKEMHFTRQN